MNEIYLEHECYRLKGGEKVNMINMLLNLTVPPAYSGNNTAEIQVDRKHESQFFQQLLLSQQGDGFEITEQQSTEDSLLLNQDLLVEELFSNDEHSYLGSIEELLVKIKEMPDDELKELYIALSDEQIEIVDELSKEELMSELVVIMHNLLNEQSETSMFSWTEFINGYQNTQQSNGDPSIAFIVNPNFDMVQPNEKVINTQLDEIYAQVESLLANVTDEQEMIRISPRILELLENWTVLTNKSNSETTQNNTMATHSTSETKVQAIWEELLSTYQKRNELVTSQHYQTNAKVTTKDVSKWLQNIVGNQSSVEELHIPQTVNISNQPLSKVEQYVIYLNQGGASQSEDKQFIDQFQQVMRTSRFLSFNNGVNQLSIALRPDNLGEMMVRFTELDGEMTVKIIVSSQSARQMLESNIHQLKNMFSPHQVVIEEREMVVDHAHGQPEEQAFDEEKDQSHESNQEESRNADQEYETEFHDLLMNAKV